MEKKVDPSSQEPQESPEEKETISLSKEEYQKLSSQIQELETFRDQFLRNAADYENARKRLAKEREEFIRFSQEKLIRDLLPILDNFERALSHASDKLGDNAASKSFLTGVQMIWKQLLDLLGAHGLKRLSSESQAFDPHLHESVDEVEEEGPEGIIVKELAPAYQLYDRVIRPAKVRIRVRPQGPKGKTEEKEEEIT